MDDWDLGFEASQVADVRKEEVEACEMRSDTESEDDVSSSSSQGFASPWWARELIQAAARLGFSLPRYRSHPVQVVSGCTGCSAESAVLKARVFMRFNVSVAKQESKQTRPRARHWGWTSISSPHQT